MDQEIIKMLQAPFPVEDLEWKIGATNTEKTRGLAMPYITARAVQERLDQCFGVTGWKNSFEQWGNGGQLCTISIWDDEKGMWISKTDGAPNSEYEALKGGLSDAMKRAAVQFGIGRYLYRLPKMWVPVEHAGRSLKIQEGFIPQLPTWALPEGYQPPAQNNNNGSYGQQNAPQQNDNQDKGKQQGQDKQGQQNQNKSQQRPLSDKQINRAGKKAEAAGMTMDDINTWINRKYNKQDIRDLTWKEYDALCYALDKYAEQKKTTDEAVAENYY